MKTFGDPTKPDTFAPGFTFLKDMQANIYPPPADTDQMVELMKKGDVWLMAFWNDYGLSVARDQNITFMTNYFPTEGVPVRNTPIAVPRSAAHKMAGLLFLNYALSDTAQKELSQVSRQLPASVSQGVWKDMPADAFGYPLDYLQSRTFAFYNSEDSLKGVQAMVDQYDAQVLGK